MGGTDDEAIDLRAIWSSLSTEGYVVVPGVVPRTRRRRPAAGFCSLKTGHKITLCSLVLTGEAAVIF